MTIGDHRPAVQHLNLHAQRILLIGDLHAAGARALRPLFAAGRGAGADAVVFLGDLELDLAASIDRRAVDEVDAALEPHDLRAHAIAGNHDRWDVIETLPMAPDGCRVVSPRIHILQRIALIDVNGFVIAAAAGAASLDGERPGEVLTAGERDALIAAAAQRGRVDVLLGHDNVGAGTPGTHLFEMLDGESRWEPRALERARRESRLYTLMAEQLRPALAVGGHLHLFHEERIALGRAAASRAVVLSAVGTRDRGPAHALLDLGVPGRLTVSVPPIDSAAPVPPDPREYGI